MSLTVESDAVSVEAASRFEKREPMPSSERSGRGAKKPFASLPGRLGRVRGEAGPGQAGASGEAVRR